jgi:hypothetical protein
MTTEPIMDVLDAVEGSARLLSALDQLPQPLDAAVRFDLCPLCRRQTDGALLQLLVRWLRRAAHRLFRLFHSNSICDAESACNAEH